MDVILKDGSRGEQEFADKDGARTFRHTTSHILAQAVKRLYPDTKLAIGPAIEDGFYYDFEFKEPISSEDFSAIEKEMKKIVKERLPLERFTLSRDEAIAFMKERNEDYKVELIEDLPEDAVISFYRQGEFVDLCAGPHLDNTKYVKAIKLTSLAGAYWRGSEQNKMLTRIYGTCFPDKEQLKEYLDRIEEAKKRDHRKLGKELGIFTLMEEGPGFPFFLPKGMVLKNTLIDYWRKLHEREGYQEISTPIILNRKLWETSGHWDHYRDNMYTTVIDGEDYAVKPMNCPGGMLVYKSQPRSYRDLPLRIGELDHLPLRDGEADFACINLVLHHLSHPEAAIREMARVLRPGGVVLVTDFDRHQDETMRNVYGDRWLGFTREELTTALKAAGLEPVDCRRREVKMGLALHLVLARKRGGAF